MTIIDTNRTRTDTARRLTGLTPTGHLHLGNYLAAIRPMVDQQHGQDTLVFLSDLHALTVEHDPRTVAALTREQAGILLAAGIDPDVATFFVQSHVPELLSLHYLLECATAYGEAARMIQFKEKSRRIGDAGVRLSLLSYPVLMAADILLYDVDEVPVGGDQRQHLELTRDVALRFNRKYGETFVVPRVVIPEAGARIMDLADPAVKMSKTAPSPGGVLFLLDPPDLLRRKVMRAITDADGEVRPDRETKPGLTTLLELLARLLGDSAEAVAGRYTSYGKLKADLADAVVDTVAPLQRRYAEITADPDEIDRILARGAERARERAAPTVDRARRAIGLMPAGG